MESSKTVEIPPAKVQQPVFEKIWKYMLFLTSILCAIFINKIFKYRSDPSNQINGNHYHLLYAVIPMLLIHYLKKILDLKLCHAIALRLCDKRFPTWEKKEERSHLLAKWIFDTFYYMIMSVISAYILSDHESFPKLMDGELACKNVMNRQVPKSYQTAIEVLYIIQFGNHLYSLLGHALNANVYGKSKFYEYCLHHGMAVFLIFYSYMLNLWVVGTMVLIFHDFSDSIIILARFYLVTQRLNQDIKDKSTALMTFLYSASFIVWVICRLILFPSCCIMPMFYASYPPEVMIMFGMGIALLVMHIYWTYHFIRSATFKKRNGEY